MFYVIILFIFDIHDVQMQVFQKLEVVSVSQSLDVRFDFLIRKVLPDHSDPLMGQTMIYVPSYFDFVRIRNYLRKQEISFVQLCEYSKVIMNVDDVTFFEFLCLTKLLISGRKGSKS